MSVSAPPASGELTKDQLLEAYRVMRTIREFEERLHTEFATGEIPGFVHLYAGEDAEVIRTPQPDGSTRFDLNLTGQQIFIAKADPAATAASPQTPYMGLDHFGLTVENIDAAVAELKGKGVAFTMEPKTIRPGVRIAFLTAPQNVSIELIQRG